MLTFLVIEFNDGLMYRRFEDFPILPIGTAVFFAVDSEAELKISSYMMNLDEPVPNVCCFLDGIDENLDSEMGPGLGTWASWLLSNGYCRGLPEERRWLSE